MNKWMGIPIDRLSIAAKLFSSDTCNRNQLAFIAMLICVELLVKDESILRSVYISKKTNLHHQQLLHTIHVILHLFAYLQGMYLKMIALQFTT